MKNENYFVKTLLSSAKVSAGQGLGKTLPGDLDAVTVIVLGSGSGGNSVVLQRGNDSIMIDAGFAIGELLRRLKGASVDLASIRALFVTHGHSDHVGGAADMARHAGIPVHMSEELFLAGTTGAPEFKPWLSLSKEEVSILTAWDRIVVGGFQIVALPVSHDAASTVGFVVTAGDLKLALVTDAGDISGDVMEIMMGADVIMLECNHDNDMLWSSKRHFLLKKRIAGPMGHLSNTRCADILSKLVTAKTRDVVLLHLSQECNTPELAAEAVRLKNPALGDGSIRLHVAAQDEALSFTTNTDIR